MKNVTLPEKMYVEVPVKPGIDAHVMLFVPPGIDRSGRTKYPLLVNV
jgi:hypothetical protein